MRTLTAHQPVYLPWLGLLHKIALADVYVFLDTVKYLKQDWNNRNQIKTPQGPHLLTVPVATGGSDRVRLDEVRIAQSDWQRRHWQSIKNFYARAPHFKEHEAFFEQFYRGPAWTLLAEMNLEMLKYLLSAFGINTPLIRASERSFNGAKNELLVDICRQCNADTYIFGALGRDYAEPALYAANGIAIRFQAFRHPTYSQVHGEFVSHLAALDLLFCHGPRSLEILMRDQDTLDSGTVAS